MNNSAGELLGLGLFFCEKLLEGEHHVRGCCILAKILIIICCMFFTDAIMVRWISLLIISANGILKIPLCKVTVYA
jgi:hypothetical protein